MDVSVTCTKSAGQQVESKWLFSFALLQEAIGQVGDNTCKQVNPNDILIVKKILSSH